MVDSYIQMDTFFFASAVSQPPLKTSPCPFFSPRPSLILRQFSRTGDFHNATVKSAMKIVATAQMVRSFM